MSVKWQKEFATGVVEIDLQHQRLFSKLDDLLDAIEKRKGQEILLEVLNFLNDYTQIHFAAEEGLQQNLDYPNRVIHCEEHKIFLKNLKDLKFELTAYGPTDEIVNLTRDTLVDWLTRHVCSTDQLLGDFIKEQRNPTLEKFLRSHFQH